MSTFWIKLALVVLLAVAASAGLIRLATGRMPSPVAVAIGTAVLVVAVFLADRLIGW